MRYAEADSPLLTVPEAAAYLTPGCLACGRGPVWGGRCRLCHAWQRTCEGCGARFASHRRHALTCGPRCKKRRQRLPRPIPLPFGKKRGQRGTLAARRVPAAAGGRSYS